MQLPVLTTGKSTSTKLAVSDAVFAVENSPVLLAQAVRVYLARLRQGTAKTKTRAEVARTKKKWFKQKGTGNARHGARTPNIFVGGGVSHGPTGTQNWSLDLTGRMKHQALTTALTAQAEFSYLIELDEKTEAKTLRKTVSALQPNDETVLVVIGKPNAEVVRKIRNMANLMITTAAQVTALDVVQANSVVLTQEAVELIEKRIKGELNTQVEVAKAAAKPATKAKTSKKTETK